jgi:ABC-type sugar transport system permease subunit
MCAGDAFAIIAVVIVLLSTAILLSRRMKGKNIALWLSGTVLAVLMVVAGVVWAICHSG